MVWLNMNQLTVDGQNFGLVLCIVVMVTAADAHIPLVHVFTFDAQMRLCKTSLS